MHCTSAIQIRGQIAANVKRNVKTYMRDPRAGKLAAKRETKMYLLFSAVNFGAAIRRLTGWWTPIKAQTYMAVLTRSSMIARKAVTTGERSETTGVMRLWDPDKIAGNGVA